MTTPLHQRGRVTGPIAPDRRIEAVDIARGFALLGVLAVNMLDFSGPVYQAAPWAVSSTWWDQSVELIVRVFGEGAFYTIFSFLFGLGFALQNRRAAERGTPFVRTFAARLSVLGVFGALHAFLIWEGDILLRYAVVGFTLLAFARTSARTKLRWCVGLTAFTLVSMAVISGTGAFASDLEATSVSDLGSEIAVHTSGSFSDMVAHRTSDWLGYLLGSVLSPLPWFAALFLAGAWAVESGKLANWRHERAFLIRVMEVSIPVAIVTKGLVALLIVSGEQARSEALAPLLSITGGGAALGATYLCLIALGLQAGGWGTGTLASLAPAGRMALTNYLSQSVLAVIFFNGFGLGLYNQLGTAAVMLLAAGLFITQVAWSRWWLRRFRFGPLEWLWRALTYQRIPPLRVAEAP